MRILCVSHSSRLFFEARVRVNELRQRFHEKRLDSLPPFRSLPSLQDSIPFSGSLSLWEVSADNDGLRFLKSYEPDSKVQSASFVGDKLLIYSSDCLTVLNPDFTCDKEIRDSWMAGGHTVFPTANGEAWLSCAAANAAICVDIATGNVIERLSMPEIYGKGYSGHRKHMFGFEPDFREHYVPTDLQPTHVNCVVPFDGGLLVTLWIQGVIGRFDEERNYSEIVGGFQGCHGGRMIASTGEIMLSDSPAGLVWFMDADTGAIRQRIDLDSRWVHDAELIDDETIAATLGDKNEIRLVDRHSGKVVFRENCDGFGRSVMFVNAYDVSDAWETAFEKISPRPAPTVHIQAHGPELIASQMAQGAMHVIRPDVEVGVNIRTTADIESETLMLGDVIDVPPGEYLLSANVIAHDGGVSVGLVDAETLDWICTCNFDQANNEQSAVARILEPVKARMAFAANNPNNPGKVSAEVIDVSFRAIQASESEDKEKFDPLADWTDVEAMKGGLLPPIVTSFQWNKFIDDVQEALFLYSGEPLTDEYLYASDERRLAPGEYLFQAHAKCFSGKLSIGLNELGSDTWFCHLRLDEMKEWARQTVTIEKAARFRVVVSADNFNVPLRTNAAIHDISLVRITTSDDEETDVLRLDEQDYDFQGDELQASFPVGDLGWNKGSAVEFDCNEKGLTLVTDASPAGYQAYTSAMTVPDGYLVAVDLIGEVHLGAVSFGLLAQSGENWLGTRVFGKGLYGDRIIFDPKGKPEVSLVIANANQGSSRVEMTSIEVVMIPRGLLAENLLPPVLPDDSWSLFHPKVKKALVLHSRVPLTKEYLYRSKKQALAPGTYIFRASVVCVSGQIMVGLIDFSSDSWLHQLEFDNTLNKEQATVKIGAPTTARIIISANNASDPKQVHALIESITLRRSD